MPADNTPSDPKPRSIFRQEALEQLQSPEQLEQLLQVTNRRSWLTLGVIGIFLVGFLCWSVVGQIPVTVRGQAIVIHPGQVASIQVAHSGYLETLNLDPGDKISIGDIIGKIRVAGATSDSQDVREYPVISRYDGIVLERSVASENFVVAGQVVGYIEKEIEQTELVVVGYFSETDGQQLKKGMSALISPVTMAPQRDGNLLGVVESVSEYPVSFEAVVSLVGFPELASKLTQEQPRIQAMLALHADESTPSGYQWTSGKGPNLTLKSGTSAALSVTTRYIRPISYVVPFFKSRD